MTPLKYRHHLLASTPTPITCTHWHTHTRRRYTSIQPTLGSCALRPRNRVLNCLQKTNEIKEVNSTLRDESSFYLQVQVRSASVQLRARTATGVWNLIVHASVFRFVRAPSDLYLALCQSRPRMKKMSVIRREGANARNSPSHWSVRVSPPMTSRGKRCKAGTDGAAVVFGVRSFSSVVSVTGH